MSTKILRDRFVWWYNTYIDNIIIKGKDENIIIVLPQEPLQFLLNKKTNGVWIGGSMNRCFEIQQLLTTYNKKLTIYIGDDFDVDVNKLCDRINVITWDSIDFFAKLNIHKMPTYFGVKADASYYDAQKEVPPTKLFTTMTNIKPARPSRIYVINEFYKHGIINHGNFVHRLEPNFPIHDYDNIYINTTSTLYSEKIELEKVIVDSWKPFDLRMDSDRNYEDFTEFQILSPHEYMTCAFDAVIETTIETLFITEKTVRAIDAKKPFFVFGCSNFHSKLRDKYGFKLYDEIIDYRFDSIEHNARRFDGQINEMKKMMLKYTPEEIFHLTKEKVDHNFSVLTKIRNSRIVNIPDDIYFYVDNEEFQNTRNTLKTDHKSLI